MVGGVGSTLAGGGWWWMVVGGDVVKSNLFIFSWLCLSNTWVEKMVLMSKENSDSVLSVFRLDY